MEFKKYNSIENPFQTNFIRSVRQNEEGNPAYVVQEKAHGANFCFVCDGHTIKLAKRSGFLEENETFYNADDVLEKYKTNVFSLFETINNSNNINSVSIFGELIGGAYPHLEVSKVKSSKLIQKGVYYCLQNNFFAFDIRVD